MYVVRRLYRDPGDRLVAGVASGIAGHLGLPVVAVRIAFVVMLPFGGLGAVMYAVFWAVLSAAPGVAPARRRKRRMVLYLGFAVAALAVQQATGVSGGLNAALGWLAAVIAIGAGTIWHLADPDRRRRLRPTRFQTTASLGSSGAVGAAASLGSGGAVGAAESLGSGGALGAAALLGPPGGAGVTEASDRRWYLLRIVGGGACVIVGVIGVALVLAPHVGVGFGELLGGLLYAMVALAGVAVVIAPLLWRMFSQLRAERVGRIREQERAEIAAMVHDQVLHTLALIQRKAADPKEVARLARGQERTLRNWLYKPVASPTERFSAAVEEVVAEVEDTYAVAVESVVVGDVDVTEQVAALVAAAREALVNAARHAKVGSVSLYAEVESDAISVFVRDRGIGFDPAEVGPDRHGVRGSIMGRMERHGGRSEIRSAPGDGTEVRLTMPNPTGKERHG